MDRSILIIYTGGTIGSVQTATGGLAPLDFSEIHRHVPELVQDHLTIEAVSFEPPIDSSNMGVTHWVELARMIHSRYDEFDGFVILHGTDTLAYTASALSFMLEGLHKPVILTGSQLPIGLPRTDGRENRWARRNRQRAAARRAHRAGGCRVFWFFLVPGQPHPQGQCGIDAGHHQPQPAAVG